MVKMVHPMQFDGGLIAWGDAHIFTIGIIAVLEADIDGGGASRPERSKAIPIEHLDMAGDIAQAHIIVRRLVQIREQGTVHIAGGTGQDMPCGGAVIDPEPSHFVGEGSMLIEPTMGGGGKGPSPIQWITPINNRQALTCASQRPLEGNKCPAVPEIVGVMRS